MSISMVIMNWENHGLKLEDVCHFIFDERKGASLIQRYATMMRQFADGSCLQNSYHQYVKELSQTNITGVDDIMRPWMWQKCKEIGAFKTTDSENQPFGDGIGLNMHFYMELCQMIFPRFFDPALLRKNLEKNRQSIQDSSKMASRVIFVNGMRDPYHSLGYTTSYDNPPYARLVTEGAPHAAEFHQSKASDLMAVNQTRARVVEIVTSWMES